MCGDRYDFLPMHKRAKNRFVHDDDDDEGEMTVTARGAVTGAFTAHPLPAMILLVLGAIAWAAPIALERAGVSAGLGIDPRVAFGIAGLDLALALLVAARLGPVQLLVSSGMAAQLVVIVGLAATGGPAAPLLLYGMHAAAGLGLSLGDPRRLRRLVSATVGVIALAGALLVPRGTVTPVEEGRAHENASLGYRLLLPERHRALAAADLAGRLTLPEPTMTRDAVAFGAPEAGELVLLTFSRGDAPELQTACEAAWETVTITTSGSPVPLPRPVPAAMGRGFVYPLPVSAGSGLFACSRLADGRLVTLSVAGRANAAEPTEALFDRVGAGLSLE